MRKYRLLGIMLGLLGVGCDGSTGPMGAIGETGATGAMGPQGAMGPVGDKGPLGDARTQIVTGTCNTIVGSFTCDVACEGLGVIAIANAGWEATPDQASTLYLNSSRQDGVDPGLWHFNFGTEGVTPDVPITMSIVCFTPPE